MASIYNIVLLVSVLVATCSSYVVLEMWENGCKGGWYRNDRIDTTGCYSWPSAGGGNRGIQMTYGSCLAVFRDTSCQGSNGVIRQINVCYPAEIYGARICVKENIDMRCSPGQIVKTIEISENGVSEGLSIQCYRQEVSTSFPPNEIFKLTNSTVNNPNRTTCENGIRGLVNEVDDVRDVVVTTNPICKSDQCPDGEAVVGITATVEEFTELIKNLTVICAPVGKLAGV